MHNSIEHAVNHLEDSPLCIVGERRSLLGVDFS
jgi:hypothetical protein